MTQARKTRSDIPSFDEAVFSPMEEADEKVRLWQATKIRAGIDDADAGRFATKEELQAIIKKYIPNG